LGDGLNRFEGKTDAVFGGTPIPLTAMIDQGRKKLVKKIAMGHVKLHPRPVSRDEPIRHPILTGILAQGGNKNSSLEFDLPLSKRVLFPTGIPLRECFQEI
jgi:hypothetical protein